MVQTHQAGFEALADPTRRGIFEALGEAPCSVGGLAARVPVSRPAVSQHLRVLKQAGLVTATASGTRRIYAVDRAGLAGLRAWFDRFWTSALADFAAVVSDVGDDGDVVDDGDHDRHATTTTTAAGDPVALAPEEQP